MKDFLVLVQSVLQPLIGVLAEILLPVLALWVTTRLSSFLDIKDEATKIKIEQALRDALHKSAENAARLALMQIKPGSKITSEIVARAVDYVKEKNPETLEKLGVTDGKLVDIVLANMAKVQDPPAPS